MIRSNSQKEAVVPNRIIEKTEQGQNVDTNLRPISLIKTVGKKVRKGPTRCYSSPATKILLSMLLTPLEQ